MQRMNGMATWRVVFAVLGTAEKITEKEVEEAIKAMKGRKAEGRRELWEIC